MRFLILNTDYGKMLEWFYGVYGVNAGSSYRDQLNARNNSLFGTADFYSRNLVALGQDACDIHVNNEHMQRMWANEHDICVSPGKSWQFRLRRGIIPWVNRGQNKKWIYEILAAQIKYYKPDIVLNHDISLSSQFFKEMKPYIRFLIGQHAAPLPQGENFQVYDLMLSSLPNFVEYFQQLGLKAELFRLAFESTILQRMACSKKYIPVSFVGSLSPAHGTRREWLKAICECIDVSIHGPDSSDFLFDSRIHDLYQGTAWGGEMYDVLHQSQITLNHHINAASLYANNMRLFEATGMGALLLTDWKSNLNDMFCVGKEIIAYRSIPECIELIRYYISHTHECCEIARAGQARTLREHTYYCRMQELLKILKKYQCY